MRYDVCMTNWKVKIDKQAEKEIKELISNGKLTARDFAIIREWIKFVEMHGPYKLDSYKLFNFRDHELTRGEKWKECRSSSFSYSGRIIYKIIDNKVIVEVLRITPEHDYS